MLVLPKQFLSTGCLYSQLISYMATLQLKHRLGQAKQYRQPSYSANCLLNAKAHFLRMSQFCTRL